MSSAPSLGLNDKIGKNESIRKKNLFLTLAILTVLLALADPGSVRLARKTLENGTAVSCEAASLTATGEGTRLYVVQPARNFADSELSGLALRSDVSWVELFHSMQFCNAVVVATVRAASVRTALELDGAGEMVMVADPGLDTGDNATLRGDFGNKKVIGAVSGAGEALPEPFGFLLIFLPAILLFRAKIGR